MRPRIRTIKPEIWADEAVGHLGPWERLLFVGLITMADDEGRLRAPSAAVIGHVFPYDGIAHAKVRRWLRALHDGELIVLYEIDGTPYVQICGWSKHQKITRPTRSSLPAPTAEHTGRLFVTDEAKFGYLKSNRRPVPERVRREVARRAGAIPGETVTAGCHYCGAEGLIMWARLSSGRPGSWVRFDGLELDHVQADANGGESTPENLVLACPGCNRSKGAKVDWEPSNGARTEARTG